MKHLRIKWVYHTVYLSGRHKYLSVKWLNPGVRAIRFGIWQMQIGRLSIRLSHQLQRP